MKRSSLLVFASALLLSAGWTWLPAASASNQDKRAITFTKDVAPILYRSCAECHRPGEIAPMSLLTYKEARPWAKAIREKVVSREMPPWHADPRYGEFSNDPRLSQNEIDTIAAWVDQGAKEGSVKDLPPAPRFSGDWEIGQPDLVLSMPRAYTLEAAGADDYIYFRIPANFTEDKWIQAAEFRPGNKRVVHHAVVFIETPEMFRAAQEMARRRGITDPSAVPSVFEFSESRFTQKDGTVNRVKLDAPVINDACGAGRGSNASAGLPLLCVYAPGRNADIWPAGTAKRVPAGSNLIFQMHYAKTTGQPETDRTSVGLLFAKAPVEKMIETLTVVNQLFLIPPGADNHQATACYTFPLDAQLVNYMPHMHVRGKAMKYEAVYPDGRRETLLQVDKYDFNWQTLYKLKQPVPIPRGTKFVVTAHFDNSAKNKYNPDPTKPVRFGEPTYDEMLVGFVDYLRERPKERPVAKVDPRLYDAYVGEYTVGLGQNFTITREGDKLMFSAPGQPKLEAFPESETKFFFKLVEAKATFLKNEKGEVTELLFEINRQSLRAKKVNKAAGSGGQQ
jgi:mono/diheme cytochrome c family protein